MKWQPIETAPTDGTRIMKVTALSIQTDAHKELRAAIANATGDDDAAPECTCAAKDMTFGRCCKVTPNEISSPAAEGSPSGARC